MTILKRILILCDAHDCIRYERANHVLLKQLYVIVFLFQRHFSSDEYLLHINDRSLIDFGIFWKKECQFHALLQNYKINKPWSDINFHDYDVIISHPEYQHELQTLLLDRYRTANFLDLYTFIELEYECATIFSSVAKLFSKGGSFEIDRNAENELALTLFKRNFDQSCNYFTYFLQETVLSNMVCCYFRYNWLNEIKNVLILDDFRRAFFIGDSVYWMRTIKQLVDIFPSNCKIRINVGNPKAYKHITEALQSSFSTNIDITNSPWCEIEVNEFDTVLCDTDIIFKYLWFISGRQIIFKNDVPVYSFSQINDKTISKKKTTDFYSNVYHAGFKEKIAHVTNRKSLNVYKEIYLLEKEHNWAQQWLLKNGVLKSEKLVFILCGSSSPDKIMNDIEILRLAKTISAMGRNVKILLVTEKCRADTLWIKESTRFSEYNKLIIVDELNLREVMSLLGNKQVVAIIGPCTGLMHLSEGIYTFLLNHQIADGIKLPMMLIYAGKQKPERNYHPNNWWKNSSIASCCILIHLKDDCENKKLISLEDCSSNIETFNEVSISASEITSDMLMNFIVDKFPGFIKRISDN